MTGRADTAVRVRRWWPSAVTSPELLARVVEAYGEPHRAYHDQLHLSEVLERIDEIRSAATVSGVDWDAVVLAAYFHDVVYETPSTGDPSANEEASAAYAERELAAAGASSELTAEVVRLVRGTADHVAAEGDPNAAVLFDADLSILAAPPERYAEYVRDVRAEYAAVPDDAFAAGRSEIMRSLLAKPTLFSTAYARSRWESTARANVEAELIGR